ncbi:MAG: phosphodiester glycosidase family protein [Bacillota bacterium]
MGQRMRWRLLALLSFLTLLLTSLLPASPATGATKLPPDVVGHWAAEPIAYVIEAGIMQGYPDGTFKPDAPISRGEVYTLLARQSGLASAGIMALPAGWSRDHWSAPSGAALIQAGILIPAEEPGGGDWDAPITRASLARLLMRLQGRSAPQRGINQLIPDIQGRVDSAWISTAVAQGLMTGYPDGSFGPDHSFTRAQTAVVIQRLRDPDTRPKLWREAYRYTLPGGQAVNLQVVRANLRHPQVKVKTLWSPEGMGHTLSLADMANNAGAVAAINGTYFSAYNKQEIQDPYGALISDGRVLHLTGSRRPAFGVWPDGRARIDTFHATITGSTNGKSTWPDGWYAYAINHNGGEFGDNWVTIMTPDRGPTMGFDAGLSVVVRGGQVVERREGAVPIPQDGYVISLGGAERANFAKLFPTGTSVDWQVNLTGSWPSVSELVQAGPMLVRNGQTDIDFGRDEFSEAKITEWVYNRSAVGLTKDGTMLMVTADAVKVVDLAPLMLDLGAVDALCMDSGASSGLYYNGGYLWEPGRLLTNGIGIVVEGH